MKRLVRHLPVLFHLITQKAGNVLFPAVISILILSVFIVDLFRFFLQLFPGLFQMFLFTLSLGIGSADFLVFLLQSGQFFFGQVFYELHPIQMSLELLPEILDIFFTKNCLFFFDFFAR